MTTAAWILIMFVSYSNTAQAAVKVGFTTQQACIEAGRAQKAGFPPEAQVTWGCHPNGG